MLHLLPKDWFQQFLQNGLQNIGRQSPNSAVGRGKARCLILLEIKARGGKLVGSFHRYKLSDRHTKYQVHFRATIPRKVLCNGCRKVIHQVDGQHWRDRVTTNGWQ